MYYVCNYYVCILYIYIFYFVILVYQEGQWKAEMIIPEIYQHRLQARLFESWTWLPTAEVEVTSLKSQLEQTRGSYEKQINELKMELQKERSSGIDSTQCLLYPWAQLNVPTTSWDESSNNVKKLEDMKERLASKEKELIEKEAEMSLATKKMKERLASKEKELVVKETELNKKFAAKEKELMKKETELNEREEWLAVMISTHAGEINICSQLEDDEIVFNGKIPYNGNSQNAVYKGLQVTAQSLRVHNYNAWITSEKVRLGVQLRHPNIQIFFGAMRSKPIIISEFMPTSLHQELMEAKNKIEHITVLSIGEEIAVALNYLHHYRPQAIIYGSLTSSNVLLEPSSSKSKWKAKLSNNCSAFSVQVYDQNRYEAPECSQEKIGSPALDVYSLGILLLEMRRPHFKIQEKDQIVHKLKWVALKNVIVQCITSDHLQRPPIAHIVSALKEIDPN